jgi:hypothetical protein
MAEKKTARPRLPRPVTADRLDLRDRPYVPDVSKAPPARIHSLKELKVGWGVLNQEETSACTGFALARVIDYLLHRAERAKESPVSPYMLYSMARRYDEFPGFKKDEGSSLRGALKGWYKHGACANTLWPGLKMPPAQAQDPTQDWWQDAARRPLGAYYRIDTRAITDMHLAIRDVGALYASAVCHEGWDEGWDLGPQSRKDWLIPQKPARLEDGGHAFVIVGYDARGFLLLNSWSAQWGDGGLATLSYQDWLDNAMDCWVAQLGVVTDQHRAVSRALTLRTRGPAGKVEVAADVNLRNQELAPFIVNMGNNGELSASGSFRTSPEDLDALLDIHLAKARERWGLGKGVVDVAIYAHGGLTSEETAADTAARWIPALYDAHVFPIFFMWESDLLTTLRNRVRDIIDEILNPPARPTAGLRDQIQRLLNQRIERTLARPGSLVWGEMKQNADGISGRANGGARLLYEAARKRGAFTKDKVRLHLIGHSAGAIVHCHLIDRLAAGGWHFSTVSFMAPAVRCDLFEKLVVPRLGRTIGGYLQLHLKEEVEERDPTCRPILGYGRSLLYLVSESFENGRREKILGLERDFTYAGEKGVKVISSPGVGSISSTHGAFDDDTTALASVLRFIGSAPAIRAGRAGRRVRAGRAARVGRR